MEVEFPFLSTEAEKTLMIIINAAFLLHCRQTFDRLHLLLLVDVNYCFLLNTMQLPIMTLLKVIHVLYDQERNLLILE